MHIIRIVSKPVTYLNRRCITDHRPYQTWAGFFPPFAIEPELDSEIARIGAYGSELRVSAVMSVHGPLGAPCWPTGSKVALLLAYQKIPRSQNR